MSLSNRIQCYVTWHISDLTTTLIERYSYSSVELQWDNASVSFFQIKSNLWIEKTHTNLLSILPFPFFKYRYYFNLLIMTEYEARRYATDWHIEKNFKIWRKLPRWATSVSNNFETFFSQRISDLNLNRKWAVALVKTS